jgi:hypothetical protein
VQYNFYMHMSQVTSSHFVKYICDIYSEYITTTTGKSELFIGQINFHRQEANPTEVTCLTSVSKSQPMKVKVTSVG